MFNSLQTVWKSRALSKKAYQIILGFVLTIAIFACLSTLTFSLSNAIVNVLRKMGEIKFDVTPIYITLFIIYITINFVQIGIFIVTGCRLIYVIRKNSIKK